MNLRLGRAQLRAFARLRTRAVISGDKCSLMGAAGVTDSSYNVLLYFVPFPGQVTVSLPFLARVSNRLGR